MRHLIAKPEDLKPDTPWLETTWAWTGEEELIDHTTKARLCAAALLPFRDQRPDWDGFIASIRWMQSAADHFDVELVVVLNADTGYIFDLDDLMYAEVLSRFRAEFPTTKFIAGITARGAQNDTRFKSERYRPLMDIVQQHDNCEVMLMTSKWLSALEPEPCRDAYYEIAEWLVRPGIVHALEPAFVPWAKPFGPWLLWQLANHPKFVGGKISTLDEPHFLYWAAMCRDQKVDFSPHSGDDFGIATAIKLGCPLLIGAAVSAAPLIQRARDSGMFKANIRAGAAAETAVDVPPAPAADAEPVDHAAQKAALHDIIVNQALKIAALEAEIERLTAKAKRAK